MKARQAALEREQSSQQQKPIERKRLREVYQEYCENGRKDRAYNTKEEAG